MTNHYHVTITLEWHSDTFQKGRSWDVEYDTFTDLKQGFLKRFRNLRFNRRLEKDRQKVKELTYTALHISHWE